MSKTSEALLSMPLTSWDRFISLLLSSRHHLSWRIRVKIIRTVLCCVEYDSCTQ